MASTTEKQLQQMISINSRIETMLDKALKKKDKSSAGGDDPVTTLLSTEFVKITTSLQGIEEQSKKTNKLLEKLIKVNTYEEKGVAKELSKTAKTFSGLGKSTEKLLNAVKIIGQLPEKAIDKFRSVIMLTAYLDPKTGKELVSDKQHENAKNTSKLIMNLVGGIALFGLTLVAFSLVLPQIMKGFLGFTVVVAGLALTILTVGKALEWGGGGFKDTSALHSLKELAVAIAGFGLTMVLFSFVTPLIARGALGFITVLAGLTLAILLVGKALEWGGGGFKDTSALHTLNKLALSIAGFGVLMVLFSFVLPQIAFGALGFITVVSALAMSIYLMSKVLNGSNFSFGGKGKGIGAPDKKGRGPLHDLAMLLFAVSITAAVLIGVGIFAQQAAIGALVMVLSITALTGVAALTGNERVRLGANNLIILGAALAIFAGSLAVYSQLAAPKLTWENLAMLGTAISTMGLIGTVLGIPPISTWIASGVASLILISAALTIFAGGLAVYSQLAAPKLTWQNLAMLGASITAVAAIATVLGIPPIPLFAGLGAAALIAISGGLLVFSGALAVFAASGFKEKNATDLNSALRAAMAGVLGYKSLGDIGPLQLLKMPLMISSILAAGAAIIPMSLALLPFTYALSKFKSTSWTPNDSIALNSAITSVIKGFSEGLNDVNWAKLWISIKSLKNVGTTLSGIAEGVQGFANLSFNEYALDEKTGEMKLVNKVKLTQSDIVQTGISIGQVIGAITAPLAKFGETMMGKNVVGIQGVNWGKVKAITFGINSLQGIGSGLVNLSRGVQDWANMTITEWGIQKDKNTGLNTLVPVKRRKISSTEISQAIGNISDILSVLGQPLSSFGEFFMSNKTGFWGNTYKVQNKGLKSGIESMVSIGGGLVNMADAVAKWSNMQYTKFGIGRDKNTGLNTLMPVGTGKITQDHIDSAIFNIGNVLTAMAYPLSEFGKLFTTTKGTWYGGSKEVTNEGLITGIKEMGNISNLLSTMASVVGNWANLTYTEMEYKRDPRTGTMTLQPKALKTLGVNGINKAIANIKLVISSTINPIIEYGKIIGADSEKINNTVDLIKRMQNNLGKIAGDINKVWGNEQYVKSAESFKLWMLIIADPFVTRLLNMYTKMGYSIGVLDKNFRLFSQKPKQLAFTSFVDNMIKLSKVATPFERFANSFDRMAKSMKTFSKNFTIMNPDAIKAFSIWSDSLLNVVKIGKETINFDKGLQNAEKSINAGFQYGKSQLGLGKEKMSDNEKVSVIDETIKQKTDTQGMTMIMTMTNALNELKEEMQGIKTTLMYNQLKVYIDGVDPTLTFNTSEE